MFESETRKCKNCQKSFTLSAEDFSFCEVMKVNLPELCFQCGIQGVMSWRNEHTLYWGICGQCQKKTLSMYHPESPYTVYCHECWQGDGWDGSDYARDYDSHRPLLDQFRELQSRVPREALVILNSTGCDYGNHVRHSKNCYLVNMVTSSENVFYSEWIYDSYDCFDTRKVGGSEMIFECVDVTKCSRSAYLQDCFNSTECFFSYGLRGCTNCLFSSNLQNKSYHVFNKPVSKEEYESMKAKIFDGSYLTLKNNVIQYDDLRIRVLRRYAQIRNSSDCTGNFIENSNCLKECFDVIEGEEVGASASMGAARRGLYSYSIGWPLAEFFFGACVIRGGSKIKFSFNLVSSNDCSYCDSIVSCSDCIASIGIRHKQYLILNKQYSKEDYLAIKEELQKKGELGIFPDHRFSTFAYNESAAQAQYPLTKEEAQSLGLSWQDNIPFTSGKETLRVEDIPNNIKNVSDDILKEVLCCEICQRNYRIIKDELALYRRFIIPLPRVCPQCRMTRRRSERPPYKLWHRQCQCAGQKSTNGVYQNTIQHTHGTNPCPTAFETSYAPERPEIVYCEQCYQQEVA